MACRRSSRWGSPGQYQVAELTHHSGDALSRRRCQLLAQRRVVAAGTQGHVDDVDAQTPGMAAHLHMAPSVACLLLPGCSHARAWQPNSQGGQHFISASLEAGSGAWGRGALTHFTAETRSLARPLHDLLPKADTCSLMTFTEKIRAPAA